VAGVSLLGYAGKVRWQQDSQALTIKLPAEKPCEYAYSFRIKLKR